MTSFEYQNKIISLLKELTSVLHNIVWILSELNFNYTWKKTSSKEPLFESDSGIEITESTYIKLKTLANQAWNLTNIIASSINKNMPFKNTSEVSKNIINLVYECKQVKYEYNDAEVNGLLDQELISNKNSMTGILKDLSDEIISYNDKFTSKLITMKAILDAVRQKERKLDEELYEEIFHEKMPKNKE